MTSNNIEDLVRQSLHQRAEDVETTPALWQEVDRRVTRRRRLQVAVWSLAGATAVAAAFTVAPALLSGHDPTPEVEPLPPGPEQGADDDALDETPTDDASEDAPPADEVEPTEPGESGEAGGSGPVGVVDALPEPVLVASGRTIEIIGPDGRSDVLVIPDEGESWIMGVAVRPGSTVDDYTAAVLTTAEGFWDLRHLRGRDGEVEPVPPILPEVQHRPSLSEQSIPDASVSGPVFSPDGDALAWIERTPDAVSLRIIGWTDEGPGTGRTADDNASFEIDAELASFELQDWVPAVAGDGDATHWLRFAAVDGGPSWRRLAVQRQPDGAWSLPSSGTARAVSESGQSSVAALAGVDADGQPEWFLRVGDDDAILTTGPAGEYRTYPSLDGLLPGEGLPTLWVRVVGDGALVGSPNTSTAYLVNADGNVGRLQSDVAWAAPIR